MRRRTCRKKFRSGAEKRSSGICRPGWEVQASSWLSRPCFGPDQIFKPGQKHQKMIRNGSKIDGSGGKSVHVNPMAISDLFGQVPGQKSQKYAQKPPGIHETHLRSSCPSEWFFLQISACCSVMAILMSRIAKNLRKNNILGFLSCFYNVCCL